MFQPIQKYCKGIARVSSGNYIYFLKSRGVSNEKINSNTASNHSITPELSYYGTKTRVNFDGSCLKQDKATYNHGTIVNIYIVYEISKNYNISINIIKYCGYGIGFNRKGEFSFDNVFSRNCIIFREDIVVLFMLITKNILVLGKYFVQGLDNTTIYAEKLYSISFTENNKKILSELAL